MLIKLKKPKIISVFTGLCTIILLAYASSGIDAALIEDLSIPLGLSFDVDDKTDLTYKQGILIYGETNKYTKSSDFIITSESVTPARLREVRNTKLNKKNQGGLARIYIFGEKQARLGIKKIVDLSLITPQINDRLYFAVCRGEALDILKYTDEKNISSAEYVEGLINASPDYNFFSKKFTLLDVLMNIAAEGENTVLPYIEASNEGLIISGLALFRGDKMIAATNMQDAKYISLLKFNKVKGILTLQQNSLEYTDFLAKSKRKVKCYKSNDKYKFIVDINLKGEIMTNELYKNLYTDTSEFKQFEKDMENQVKKECMVYIEKIKQQYQTDILDLGSCAVAKYGRDTGVDWNKVVSESDIEVKVKVKVTKQGRGDF